MRVQIARWGNSLGVRIPKALAARVGIVAGASVEVEAKQGRIVISSARPHYSLDELLTGMTRKAMREAFDWGDDAGREVVPD